MVFSMKSIVRSHSTLEKEKQKAKCKSLFFFFFPCAGEIQVSNYLFRKKENQVRKVTVDFFAVHDDHKL